MVISAGIGIELKGFVIRSRISIEQEAKFQRRHDVASTGPVAFVIPRPKREMPSFKLESHIETLAANRNKSL